MPQIAAIETGYVGLSTGACCAHGGHLGLDSNNDNGLEQREIPIAKCDDVVKAKVITAWSLTFKETTDD